MFTVLLIFAFPQVSPSLLAADRPPQVSKSLLPCGVKNCDCGCAEGATCVCRPDGIKSRSLGHKTYAEWRAATAKKRAKPANPYPGLAPRPVTFTPVFRPFFTSGAACSGGG